LTSQIVQEDVLARKVIDCAMRVHSALGPGLLESAYEVCLAHELGKAQLRTERQVALPIHYDGLNLSAGYRLDILVEKLLVVELKTVDKIQPIHTAQLLSYLKLGGQKLGLLLNFNVVHMRDGIKRVVNNL